MSLPPADEAVLSSNLVVVALYCIVIVAFPIVESLETEAVATGCGFVVGADRCALLRCSVSLSWLRMRVLTTSGGVAAKEDTTPEMAPAQKAETKERVINCTAESKSL